MRALIVALTTACAGLAAALTFACGTDATPEIGGGDGGVDGSTTSTSGGLREAGANGVTADGGVNPTNAAPGGNASEIPCGSATCPIPAETCCISQTQAGRAYACVAGSTCPAPAGGGGDTTALKCTSAANCAAGTVCCVTQNNGVTSSQCETTCGGGGGGGGGDSAQLCDPSAGDAGGCPSTAPCSTSNINEWGLPKTFGTCGGRGN